MPRGNKEQQPSRDRMWELRSKRDTKEEVLGKALLLRRGREGQTKKKERKICETAHAQM